MSEARRRAYLDAMGIDVWIPREARSGPDAGAAPEAPDEVRRPASGRAPPVAAPRPAPPVDPPAGRPPALDPVVPPESAAGLDWAALQARVADCRACPELVASRTRPVFGAGNRPAQWLVLGGAPGADEDRLGEPFAGRAGKLLSAMLLAVGLTREQVFLTHTVRCHPPKGRGPQPAEVQACRGYLERQLELADAAVILALGRDAAQNLLQSDAELDDLRGRVHRLAGGGAVVVSYHPADLLKVPADKRKAWDDLRLAVSVSEGRGANGTEA